MQTVDRFYVLRLARLPFPRHSECDSNQAVGSSLKACDVRLRRVFSTLPELRYRSRSARRSKHRSRGVRQTVTIIAANVMISSPFAPTANAAPYRNPWAYVLKHISPLMFFGRLCVVGLQRERRAACREKSPRAGTHTGTGRILCRCGTCESPRGFFGRTRHSPSPLA